MPSAVAAARTILTRLHEVMASRMNAQAKLNTVAEVIGESLDSEVCSIYLLREGMLELFATRGLAQEAVHVTRMAIGEGLVGTIAGNVETLNLAEATAHPVPRRLVGFTAKGCRPRARCSLAWASRAGRVPAFGRCVLPLRFMPALPMRRA